MTHMARTKSAGRPEESASKKKGIAGWLRNDQFQLQSLIWPGIIFCFVFCYIPMYGIIIAFQDYNIMSSVTGAEWVGLKYFKEFLNDPALWNVVRNTLILNGLALVFSFPASAGKSVPDFCTLPGR